MFYFLSIWLFKNDWFKDVGMVIALFGIVALVCGWNVMKIAWFPIAFLVCALPWPGLFYSKLAGPLQQLAAKVAERLLHLIGVGAYQYGTKLFVEDKTRGFHTLNVAEACSGLRSLMTFIAIAGAVAFLSFRPLWQKILMVCSAIPIAIFCNTMRVTVQGGFARYGSADWAESFAHGFIGFVMMIPAFFLILLVGWVLQNIFIDEVDDKRALAARSTVMSRPRPGTASTTGRTRVIARTVAPAALMNRNAPTEEIDASAPAVGVETAPAEAPVTRPVPRRVAPAAAATAQGSQPVAAAPTSRPLATSPAQRDPGRQPRRPPRPAPPQTKASASTAPTMAASPGVAKRPWASGSRRTLETSRRQRCYRGRVVLLPRSRLPPAANTRPSGTPSPAKPAVARPNSGTPTPANRPKKEEPKQ